MNVNESLAPIALFVYNRPEHTLQTLQALEYNDLAKESILYVFCDGPKFGAGEKELKAIQETRNIVKSKSWCGRTIIKESEENMGLANSIIEGVTKTVNQHGKIIVLEDDIVTSRGFLNYMNEALEKYNNNISCMSINAYLPPFKNKGDKAFFIENGTSTWGWGTWKRAWKYFNSDANYLLRRLKSLPSSELKRFNWHNSYNYFKMLNDFINGKNNSWGIRWYTSVFLKNGFGLFPPYSFVQNIGHDGSGEHCGETNLFHHKELKLHNVVLPPAIGIANNIKMHNKFISYNKSLRPNLIKRLVLRILNKHGK